MRRLATLAFGFVWLTAATFAQTPPVSVSPEASQSDRRLILVTVDGVRWQEIFRGAEERIVEDGLRTTKMAEIKKAFLAPRDRVRALTPFIQSIPGRGGVVAGNRDANSCFRVGNRYWFSYPGYNEILTGRIDGYANSNDPVPNPDMTFLEWLNHLPGFDGMVRAAAGGTGFFAPILNVARSRIPLNDAGGAAPFTEQGDALTHAAAIAALQKPDVRVIYAAYGETDHLAHEGRYDEYLLGIRRFDNWLRELWETAQSSPDWAGKTTLIVTTDHGRGVSDLNNENWRHHGSGWYPYRSFEPKSKTPDFEPTWNNSGYFLPQELEFGSDQTWAVVLAPQAVQALPPGGLCLTANRIASTAIQSLGLDWRVFSPLMGEPFVKFKPE
ncbi:MAG TPA: hypothetical protein PLN33_01280 [Hyphomonadaceae bacterium]|nr:hypothetical protein [Hyphomonadaceae bacterium]HPN04291.1 hypothetical protein [Hyphomonadaceae bacterium]